MAEAVPERDLSLLLDMLLAACDALEFTRGMDEDEFKASRLHQNAVIRSLEVIGEAARHVSPATRSTCPDIAWREIAGMRDRLIHGYADVRIDLVWLVVREHLAQLIAMIERLLPRDLREP